MNLSEEAIRVVESVYKEVGVEKKDLLEEVDDLATKKRIPDGEAARLLRDQYLDGSTSPASKEAGGVSERAFLEDITEQGMWVDVVAKVVTLWDDTADGIIQSGLLSDGTAKMKFTVWGDESRDKPPQTLEEGEVYEIQSAVSSKYNGQCSLNLRKVATITQSDQQIGEEITGTVIKIKDGSGVITRCAAPNCSYATVHRPCPDHDQGNENDLRIKAVIDDGEAAYDIVLGRTLTEELTGTSLDHAEKLVEKHGAGAFAEQIEDQLIGERFHVLGTDLPNNLVVDNIESADFPTKADVQLLVEAAQRLDPATLTNTSSGRVEDSEQDKQAGVQTEA